MPFEFKIKIIVISKEILRKNPNNLLFSCEVVNFRKIYFPSQNLSSLMWIWVRSGPENDHPNRAPFEINGQPESVRANPLLTSLTWPSRVDELCPLNRPFWSHRPGRWTSFISTPPPPPRTLVYWAIICGWVFIALDSGRGSLRIGHSCKKGGISEFMWLLKFCWPKSDEGNWCGARMYGVPW